MTTYTLPTPPARPSHLGETLIPDRRGLQTPVQHVEGKLRDLLRGGAIPVSQLTVSRPVRR